MTLDNAQAQVVKAIIEHDDGVITRGAMMTVVQETFDQLRQQERDFNSVDLPMEDEDDDDDDEDYEDMDDDDDVLFEAEFELDELGDDDDSL